MFNKLFLIEAAIKDSYNEMRKRLKDFYKDNPKSKDRAEVVLSSIAAEALGAVFSVERGNAQCSYLL